LFGCPVGCKWCDTGYGEVETRPANYQDLSIDDIASNVGAYHVVITGGEPFIHKDLPDLCNRLFDVASTIQIETSGVYWQDLPDNAWITLSPKEHLTNKLVDDRFWQRANELKFIISSESDIDYYIQKSPRHHLDIIYQKNLFFQPEWYNRAKSIDLITDVILREKEFSHGKLSIQTHKYLRLQ
jgi:organic radical activating enzyme